MSMEQCREHDKSSLNIAPEEWCPSCLRASNAALKAENEALKKDLGDTAFRLKVRDNQLDGTVLERNEIDEKATQDYARHLCEIDNLKVKLSLYTSWQPSDPGTKEAMECAENTCPCVAHAPGLDWDRAGVLAHALRAAMVRLEESEKRDEFHVSQCAALTASLASITSEVERLKAEKDYDGKEVLAAELAELRKRMDRTRAALIKSRDAYHRRNCGAMEQGVPTCRSECRRMTDIICEPASPASPAQPLMGPYALGSVTDNVGPANFSPAPVEKMPMVVKVNPKACVKCGCGPSAHWPDNDGPLQGAYCHSCCQCADYTPPAPVGSKPTRPSIASAPKRNGVGT